MVPSVTSGGDGVGSWDDIQHSRTLLVFLNAYRNNPQVHKITVVAFHPEVFRVSYFPQGMVLLS